MNTTIKVSIYFAGSDIRHNNELVSYELMRDEWDEVLELTFQYLGDNLHTNEVAEVYVLCDLPQELAEKYQLTKGRNLFTGLVS